MLFMIFPDTAFQSCFLSTILQHPSPVLRTPLFRVPRNLRTGQAVHRETILSTKRYNHPGHKNRLNSTIKVSSFIRIFPSVNGLTARFGHKCKKTGGHLLKRRLHETTPLGVFHTFRPRGKDFDSVLRGLGVVLMYSCHHYLVGNVPRFGDHIAWASCGSQVFANSVIGARSNRDGDHVAIAAGITGVISGWGLHIDENGKGEILIDVKELDLENYDPADFKALGWNLSVSEKFIQFWQNVTPSKRK